MKKYKCERDIISAYGYQVFEVLAEDEVDAFEKLKQGDGYLVESHFQADELGSFSFDGVWEEL